MESHILYFIPSSGITVLAVLSLRSLWPARQIYIYERQRDCLDKIIEENLWQSPVSVGLHICHYGQLGQHEVNMPLDGYSYFPVDSPSICDCCSGIGVIIVGVEARAGMLPLASYSEVACGSILMCFHQTSQGACNFPCSFHIPHHSSHMECEMKLEIYTARAS